MFREDIIYFEHWKTKACPIDGQPCKADKCALFKVMWEKVSEDRRHFYENSNTDGGGYCTLPDLTKNTIETLRRIKRETPAGQKIDLGSNEGEIPGVTSAINS